MLTSASAVIAFFIFSREMVGRGAVKEVGAYLAKYIGAQVYNLDHYLNEAFRESQIFGQETFQPSVQFICARLGISQWARYNLDLPFVYAKGYELGNVYTTFYAYIHDFGYTGVIILPLLFGFTSQLIYKFSRTSPDAHTINFGLVLYSYVAHVTLFSFFSNKFGEMLFSISMCKKMLFMWLIIMFLFHVRIKGTKVYIDLGIHKKINIRIDKCG
jgi:oligosaccharide repeat unit polymerase